MIVEGRIIISENFSADQGVHRSSPSFLLPTMLTISRGSTSCRRATQKSQSSVVKRSFGSQKTNPFGPAITTKKITKTSPFGVVNKQVAVAPQSSVGGFFAWSPMTAMSQCQEYVSEQVRNRTGGGEKGLLATLNLSVYVEALETRLTF